jgi:hypothetical protein
VYQECKLPESTSQSSLAPSASDVTFSAPTDGLQLIPKVEARLDQGVVGQGACIGQHVLRELVELLHGFDVGFAATDLDGHVWNGSFLGSQLDANHGSAKVLTALDRFDGGDELWRREGSLWWSRVAQVGHEVVEELDVGCVVCQYTRACGRSESEGTNQEFEHVAQSRPRLVCG